MNGNCLGPCSFSVPARITGTCACPTNYFDDGINAQCQQLYNPQQQQPTLLSSVGNGCAYSTDGAFVNFINNTFVSICDIPSSVLVYDVSQDYLNLVYNYAISGGHALYGFAAFKLTPNYALLSFQTYAIQILNIVS